MTPDVFTKQLPRLTNNPLPIKPPFVFNGMSARIFPLRASLDTLQQLCDGYLNFIPPEAGRFRAVVPYVYLMVLDYGQVAESITRIGWFAQVEVFFSVPVEWYKLVDGKWVFHDWAVITPYIFVNDSFSVPLGRTVYGFTKVLANITPSPDRWVNDPLSPVTLARVETAVFPEAYVGKRIETQVFLEIERRAPMSNFRVPTDPLSPMMPWVVASNLAEAFGGFGRDAMWLAQAMRIFPVNPGSDPAALPQMLAHLAPLFSPGGVGFVQNSLNLKQFRSADDPNLICYQALTNGQMQTKGFNGGGLLGEDRTFFGDLSGGHIVKLYDYSSLPITRTLGLEVYRQSAGRDGPMFELKPVLPCWINVNLLYDQGHNVAWRNRDGIWKDGSGAPFSPAEISAAEPTQPPFNSSLTSAVEAIAGPFEFSGATIRVLPLLARLDILQNFVDQFVNKPLADPIRREDGSGPEKVRLSVWARPEAHVNMGVPIGGDLAYVYVTASSFSKVISNSNNVGDWAKYELSFMVPVTWDRWNPEGIPEDLPAGSPKGAWEVHGVGLLPAYTFVDSCIAAISRFEIQGIDAVTATFVRPESVWLQEGEENIASKQTFLRVDAEVWPAFGAGQKARTKTVIKISDHDLNAGLGNVESKDTPFLWAETLRAELGTKKGTNAAFPDEGRIARALALELLGNQTPFSLYTLKQFRDVRDPDKACYQEVLRVPRAFKEVFDIREIEETLVVQLHDFPSLKIAQDLGILGPTMEDSGTGIVHNAQAVRPFYIRATVTESLGERLLSRAGAEDWNICSRAFDGLLTGSPPIVADLEAESDQNQLDSCSMTALMFQARERLVHGASKRTAITPSDARKTLKIIDPQMIVESVLSREWGNIDENSHRRRGHQELVNLVAALPAGPGAADAESKMYLFVNNMMALRPGTVARKLSRQDLDVLAQRRADAPVQPQDLIGLMILGQQQFTECALELENAYNLMAPWLLPGGREGLNKATATRNPGSPDELQPAAIRLIKAMNSVCNLSVIGFAQASTGGVVTADNTRLRELLGVLDDRITQNETRLTISGALIDFVQAVELARKHCRAQRDTLLSKLSRVYQKPEFCIRRDCLGVASSNLLAESLSWDQDWYYGQDIQSDNVPEKTLWNVSGTPAPLGKVRLGLKDIPLKM